MTRYSCRFLNASGRIDDVAIIDSDSEGVAKTRAAYLFARSIYPEVELWRLSGRDGTQDQLVFADSRLP